MKLAEFKTCPVCKGVDRTESTNGIACVKGSTGSQYLKFAAEKLKISLDQLLSTIKVYQCNSCKCFYCDPWLSSATSSYVFTSGAPDHMVGWKTFENWLSSSKPDSLAVKNLELLKILQTKIGNISSYAEYGCPFQGFLLLFRGWELPVSKRIDKFSESLKRSKDSRWTTGMRIYNCLSKISKKVIVLFHRIRSLKNSFSVERFSGFQIPQNRVFITQPCTKTWGSNCVRFDGSCSYFTNKVLDADVIPLEEIGKNKFDLIGMFNILDHAHSPVETIQKCLEVSKNIVIMTHHATQAGKQHLYAFHESFPVWLGHHLKAIARVEDLTKTMEGKGAKDYNYILISRI